VKDWESIVLPLVALMAAFMLIALALLVARRLTLWLEKRKQHNASQPLPPDDQPPLSPEDQPPQA